MPRPSLALAFLVSLLPAAAEAATLRVPQAYPSIQAAIDAAAPGDAILVSAGRHCGATVTKRVALLGRGWPVIRGCAGGPALGGLLRVGLLLDGAGGTSPASGSRVSGFVFDGVGVSSANTAPLAFGILARFADDVAVTGNRFEGTVQAVTVTAGDRWTVARNRVRGLTVLDCADGGPCGGGDGVVFQVARGALAVAGGAANPVNRPEGNRALLNDLEGRAPAGFDVFSMTGLLLMSADRTTLVANRVAIRGEPALDAPGEGVLITNSCCGDPQRYLPGTRDATVALTDGRESDYVLVVEGAPGENTSGLFTLLNRGAVLLPEPTVAGLRAATTAAGSAASPARTTRTFQ